MKIRRPTGDLEVWPSGVGGHVGIGIDGTTQGGFVRLVVSLTPTQALEVAAEIVRNVNLSGVTRYSDDVRPQTTPEGK